MYRIAHLICDGVIITVVSRGASKDPELPSIEGDGAAVDGVHLGDLGPGLEI